MLVIKNLEKSYGNFKAVKGLNLEIKKGEIFGFIGPNGAGKSTTMKIISGLLSPDSGEVYVDGIDAIKNNRALKDKIGYMPDFFGVYDNLKASGDMNIRGYSADWCIPKILEFYTGRKLEVLEANVELKEIFSQNNWDKFKEEQSIFDNNIMHLCIY